MDFDFNLINYIPKNFVENGLAAINSAINSRPAINPQPTLQLNQNPAGTNLAQPKIDLNSAQTAQNFETAQQIVENQNKNPLITFDSGVPSRNENMSGFLHKMSELPALTSQQLSDAGKLYDLKSAYAIADKILADENLTDEQKNFWRGQQDNFADSAAMIRRSAVENGFNPDDYGLSSGNTLEQSTQALHYLQNRDMKNFLDLKSASEKASEKYNELRAQGVEPYRANYLANQEMGANRRDVINQLSNALDTYGINSDGSYNKYGLQILRKMYDEDPKLVNLYTSQLANPKEVYNNQNQLLNNLMTQLGANDRTAAQIAANIYGLQYGAANDLQKLFYTRGCGRKVGLRKE